MQIQYSGWNDTGELVTCRPSAELTSPDAIIPDLLHQLSREGLGLAVLHLPSLGKAAADFGPLSGTAGEALQGISTFLFKLLVSSYLYSGFLSPHFLWNFGCRDILA